MCCRYHLRADHYRELLARLGIEAPAEFLSRYNIAPGSEVPAVRNPRESRRQAVGLRWGFVPAWSESDDPASRRVNARAETLADKPSFRDAVRSRRCVLPATGFYEWEVAGRTRRPWFFRRHDERPFGLAGIWERWTASDGGVVESCAVITSEPNELMRPIHHRMPVMLRPEQFDAWLDPRHTDASQLSRLLQPAPAAEMVAFAVSPYVGNVHHEGPACLTPATAEVITESEPQLSLGL